VRCLERVVPGEHSVECFDRWVPNALVRSEEWGRRLEGRVGGMWEVGKTRVDSHCVCTRMGGENGQELGSTRVVEGT